MQIKLLATIVILFINTVSFSKELPFKRWDKKVPNTLSGAKKIDPSPYCWWCRTEAVNYDWDKNTSEWILKNKSSYTNNMYAMPEEEVLRNSNNEITGRILYTYDENNYELVVSTLTQSYNSGTWINETMHTNTTTYDNGSATAEDKRMIWNGNAWEITEGTRKDYIYDANGLTLEINTLIYKNNQWIGDEKEQLIYDQNQYVTEYLVLDYNETLMQYEPVSKEVYINNAYGFPTEIIAYTRSANSWENYKRYTDITYQYADNDYYTSSYVAQAWTGTAWENEYRETYQKGYYGGYSSVIEQYQNNLWIYDQRFTETYDDKRNFISYTEEAWSFPLWQVTYQKAEILSYEFDAYGITEYVTERIIQDWNATSQSLENKSRHVYTYADCYLLGQNQYALNDLNFYPNPAKDRLTLDFSSNKAEKLCIYNQLGQEVSSLDITDQRMQIDVSGLTPGMYIIKATGTEGIFTGKFVKE